MGLGCSPRTGEVLDAPQELRVEDFTFEGPLGSAGTRIERVGRNHFRVTLGHAPEQPGWPNKLNFRILQNARGNDLRLDVVFPEGTGYAFNEYHQSFSYDGEHWYPIHWERGHRASPLSDVLYFPRFSEDQVYVGTQVPMSYEQAEALMAAWDESPYVQLHEVGQSLGGRPLLRLEITDPQSTVPRAERWVHYFANQHPGEHNSQWRLAGLVDWLLSEEGADFRRRSIVHVVMMMSPDAPSHGWYRVNAEGVDMNRSYRPEGASAEEQAHEAYLWQQDLEALMASEAPVTTIWAIHTWGGIVEPILSRGPEIGDRLPEWTRFRDLMQENDPKGLIEPLKVNDGPSSYGAVSWSSGPHAQFGITAVLCEGAGILVTKELNRQSGEALIKSIAAYYEGTRK